jgi:hypothetical protein
MAILFAIDPMSKMFNVVIRTQSVSAVRKTDNLQTFLWAPSLDL